MGFGMIIDNSVVVLDNIFRHRARGDSPLDAAERGARGMVLPVLAATLTTLVVLIPFVYLQGELRIYYVPLAIVVALTNAASLFVSFSLLPALAWRGLRRPLAPATDATGAPRDPLYTRAYAGVTRWTLRHPWVTVALSLGLLGGSYHLFDSYVTRGIVWGRWGSNDTYIDIRITLPRGEELARTEELARHFESLLKASPEVERFVSQVRPHCVWQRDTPH
jgi:HAE1 family hydrophobic/amphiphilic exporter-1